MDIEIGQIWKWRHATSEECDLFEVLGQGKPFKGLQTWDIRWLEQGIPDNLITTTFDEFFLYAQRVESE